MEILAGSITRTVETFLHPGYTSASVFPFFDTPSSSPSPDIASPAVGGLSEIALSDAFGFVLFALVTVSFILAGVTIRNLVKKDGERVRREVGVTSPDVVARDGRAPE